MGDHVADSRLRGRGATELKAISEDAEGVLAVRVFFNHGSDTRESTGIGFAEVVGEEFGHDERGLLGSGGSGQVGLVLEETRAGTTVADHLTECTGHTGSGISELKG